MENEIPGKANTYYIHNVSKFMRERVVIDTQQFDTNRDANGGVLSITPKTGMLVNSQGHEHYFKNGLPSNIRNKRGLTHPEGIIPENVLILIGVRNYQRNASIHNGHALSAFRNGDTLYCFNPWGETYLFESVADNLVWEYLRKQYKCKHAVVYTGPDFQKLNTVGACVGFAFEFGSHMYNYILMNQLKPSPYIQFRITESKNNFFTSADYNEFIVQLFERFVGSFANGRACNLRQLTTNLLYRLKHGVQATSRTTDTNIQKRKVGVNINLFGKLSKLLKNDMAFRNLMIQSEWLQTNSNYTERMKSARSEVRRRLQEKFPLLKDIHGNMINANIRRYLGNLNLANRMHENKKPRRYVHRPSNNQAIPMEQ